MNSIEKNNKKSEYDNQRKENAYWGFVHLMRDTYRHAYKPYEYPQGDETKTIYYADFDEALRKRNSSTAKFDAVIVAEDFLMLITKKDIKLSEEDIVNIANMSNFYYEEEHCPVETSVPFGYKTSNFDSNECVDIILYPHGFEGLREESNENLATDDFTLGALLATQSLINMGG